MPGKSVRFTHRFRGRVFGIEIDHLGKVYWFWDKYSPLGVLALVIERRQLLVFLLWWLQNYIFEQKRKEVG